jgi:hypothetical protein
MDKQSASSVQTHSVVKNLVMIGASVICTARQMAVANANKPLK